MSKRVFIKGNSEYGDVVLKYFKKQGGKNSRNYSCCDTRYCYFLDKDNEINIITERLFYESKSALGDVELLSITDIYPDIKDRVIGLEVISGDLSREEPNYPTKAFKLCHFDNSNIGETIRIPVWKECVIEKNDTLVYKNIEFPNSKLLCESNPLYDDITNNGVDALCLCIKFRNLYWRMMGYEPDWNNEAEAKYCIDLSDNDLNKVKSYGKRFIFAFPAEIVRDRFYDSFINLLNKAKNVSL